MSIEKIIRSSSILGWVLIFLSSLLLGIWAVTNTIALRNILLGIETFISIIYIIFFFKKSAKNNSLKDFTPLLLLFVLFSWIIFHYFFLSLFPEQQLKELHSTWFRSLLACIVGFGAGLALLTRPHAISFLWIGILASFVYLFCQYIPKAIAADSLYAIDHKAYIYPGKISGVMMGTILLSGFLGIFIDMIRRGHFKAILLAGSLAFASTLLIIYYYVFMIDARNGVGIIVVISGLMLLMLLGEVIKARLNGVASKKIVFVLLCTGLCFMIAVSLLVQEHIKHNKRWKTLIADATIAIQVDKHPNWQNPEVMGYPKISNHAEVMGSTYERVAWATAGLTIFLPQNPYGVGVLKDPFPYLLKKYYPENAGYISSTHSAWVEIALAFGYPGLSLMLGSLIVMIVLTITSRSRFRSMVLLLSLGLIILYSLGEISSQHSIEILCFCIALMTSLLFEVNSRNFKSKPSLQ